MYAWAGQFACPLCRAEFKARGCDVFRITTDGGSSKGPWTHFFLVACPFPRCSHALKLAEVDGDLNGGCVLPKEMLYSVPEIKRPLESFDVSELAVSVRRNDECIPPAYETPCRCSQCEPHPFDKFRVDARWRRRDFPRERRFY